MEHHNKRKIVNDPVFGFIHIPNGLCYDIIQHPYFQRLNRIKQLGLSYLVYPGAQHTRFQHSIGAMFLTNETINHLRFQGHDITDDESEGVLAAILLHDVGHAPFSHLFEKMFVSGLSHEELSLMMMQKINEEMGGRLSTAIDIFQDKYPKHFLHQMLSSQLDMDRMDYLRRDSFYTGVSEGTIGSARIIKMFNVKDDKIVVEAKGIYSIEQFLIARRLMYWQVYFHKTSVAAERMLLNIMRRAKWLVDKGEELFASPALDYFLKHKITRETFTDESLQQYALLDDTDVFSSIKVWMLHSDRVLSLLCEQFINRRLFKMELRETSFSEIEIAERQQKCADYFGVSFDDARYFLEPGSFASDTYSKGEGDISVLCKDGQVKDISEASDMLNISVLSKQVRKYYVCVAKMA